MTFSRTPARKYASVSPDPIPVKNRLPLVPPVHHVIPGRRILNPQLAWHGLSHQTPWLVSMVTPALMGDTCLVRTPLRVSAVPNVQEGKERRRPPRAAEEKMPSSACSVRASVHERPVELRWFVIAGRVKE